MKKILYCYILLLGLGCREKYPLPADMPATGYLVVEGVINSGQGPTSLTLTRTLKLVDSFSISYIRNAVVRVEGKDNSVHVLNETGTGVYSSPQLNLNQAQEYRLYIRIPEGKEYRSDYRPIIKTPPISSISWERQNGVNIFANARDPQNNTKYYRWEYEETWEFNSAFETSVKYQINPSNGKAIAVFRDPSRNVDRSLWKCWKNQNSQTIEIASTAKLSQDTVHYQLVSIPNASWQLSVLYSINVKQYALSQGCYEYLIKMKKNTEQTGSIFDAQPSQLRGNIQCVTDPSEMVIGFVDIADVYTKRIFISNSDVPGWGYRYTCREEQIINHPDTISAKGFPTPTTPFEMENDFIKIFNATTDATCVDCTLRGVNVKPSFWP
jgi:hypothetical protein